MDFIVEEETVDDMNSTIGSLHRLFSVLKNIILDFRVHHRTSAFRYL